MNCKEVEERDFLEAYLLDRLSESERDEFEQHYFECDACFSQLQTGLLVQAELRRQPPQPAQARSASLRSMWAWTPAFVTAALLLAAGVWWYSAQKNSTPQQASSSPVRTGHEVSVQPQTPAPPLSLEELARMEAPPYSAVVLRGAEDEGQAAFRQAMLFYSQADYANAIPGLQTAAKAAPQSARSSFYLGACYLLTGQADLAIASLRKTVSLGEAAYSEPAHFYLAKAYLKKKEVSTAEDELKKTIRLRGSREAEAREILRQLGK